ncbi:hypothetical protein ES705_39008 [subsurface metagenome]
MTFSTITQQTPTCQDLTGQECLDNDPVSSESLSSPPASPLSMAHHNSPTTNNLPIFYKKGIEIEKRYGVPQTRRILTMGMFHKYHDEILHQLTWLGLETRERDAIFKLLELYIYYGKVYPKAADIADQAYISKRTFWRAVSKLRELSVIEVLNRYVKHRQISNLYRLDKLVVMLARFLAEHGHNIGKFGIKLVSRLAHFWQQVWSVDINLSMASPLKRKIAGGVVRWNMP